MKERVLLLPADERRTVADGQEALTWEQMKIIEIILVHGSVKTRNLVDLFCVSGQTAIKELALMVEKGMIQRRGKGRRVHYVLRQWLPVLFHAFHPVFTSEFIFRISGLIRNIPKIKCVSQNMIK